MGRKLVALTKYRKRELPSRPSPKKSLQSPTNYRNLKGSLKGNYRNLKGSLKGNYRNLKGSLKGNYRNLKGSLKGNYRNLKVFLKGILTLVEALKKALQPGLGAG